MTHDPSEERLNALIDGELTPADAAALLERLRTDASLRERIGLLRLGKELVRHAYVGIAGDVAPRRPEASMPAGTPRWRALAAALLAVGVGALLGWTAHESGGGAAGPDPDLILRFTELAARSPHGDAEHVILHVSSAAPQHGQAVLDRAEGILETARASKRTVVVEIVANGGGIDLLRDGVSVQGARIATLRAAYPQLSLVACGQTAQRLRESGIEVRLLPGTSVATSALDEIVLRMQQGWAYVRI